VLKRWHEPKPTRSEHKSDEDVDTQFVLVGQQYLHADIAKYYNVPAEMIVAGSGANDILMLLLTIVPDRPVVSC